MGRAPDRGSSKLLVLLAALLVAGVGGALFLALGIDLPEETDGVATAQPPPAEDGSRDEGPGSGTNGASKPRPTKPVADVSTIEGVGGVRGVVKLWKTREPVAGLELGLRRGEDAPLSTTTGPDGGFAFAGVPAGGGYLLRGSRAGFAPIELSVDVAPDQTADVGTLWLAVPVDLHAIVLDWTGTPLADAEVSVFAQGGGRLATPEEESEWSDDLRELRTLALVSTPKATKSAKTGADGKAVVAGLMPGTYRVEASAKERAPASRHPVVLAPEAPPVPVRIILGPAHGLSGTVFDEKGAPVTKARVIVARGTQWTVGLDKWASDVDGKGEYRFDTLPAGPVTVYLLRPGMPLLQVGYAGIPDSERFDIRLRPSGTVRGKVTSEDGKPIAGAEIVAAMQNNWSPVAAKSAADGTYELKDLPAGPLGYFRVTAEGFVPHPEPAANQEQGAGESLREGSVMVRDVVLRKGLSVQVVVKAEGGKPIEGAEILLLMARSWSGEVKPWRGTTNAEGKAEITGMLPGVYLAVVRATGFVQPGMPSNPWELVSATEAMPDAWRITLMPEGGASKEFVLSRGASVSGRVVDADGKPVAGALVSIDGAAGDRVYSGGDGKFRIDAVPPSSRAVVQASAPGHQPGWSEPFVVDAATPKEDVEVRLRVGGKIAGTLRTRDGKPLVGAMVRWIQGRIDPNDFWSHSQFDRAERHPVGDGGRFEIDGVPEGQITVRGDSEGYLPATANAVQVTARQETGGIDLLLGVGYEIRGRVEAQSGGPVVGATISCQYTGTPQNRRWGFAPGLAGNPTAQTDEKGAFALRGLEEGGYNVWAQAPGFAAGSMIQTTTGAGDVLLYLAAGKSISGTIRNEEGKPFGGVPIMAQRIDRAGQQNWYYWGGWNLVYSGPDGTFEIQDLAEGNYDLRVSGAWQWGREVNVEDTVVQGIPSGRKEVEVTVRTGQLLEGKVVDRDDVPVRVGWVSATFQSGTGGWDWSAQRWGQLRPDGSFRLAGLKPGQYDVWVYGSFRAKQEQGVSSGKRDLLVRVEPGFAIQGQVFDERGLAVDGFNVQIRKVGQPNWEWRQVVQPGDGHFVVLALEEGAWDLQIQVGGYAPLVVPNVTAGTRDLRISIRKGKEITGFAVDGSGNPVANANVQANQVNVPPGSPPSNGWAQTDAQGRFRLPGLADGEFNILVRANNFAPAFARGVTSGTMDVKFVMTPGGSIAGSVVDASGNGLQNVRLNLNLEDGLWIGNARTNQEGKFEFKNVPEGFKLRVSGQTWIDGAQVPVQHEPLLEAGAADVKIEVK